MSTYNVETTGKQCRIAIRGSLAAVLVPELQQQLKAGIEQGIRRVIFDLAESDMMDSSGIGLLIATSNSLAPTEGKLTVINTAPDLLKLLRSMRLVARLNVSGRCPLEHEHE